MKIAILLPNLVGGGVERIRLVLASEFISLGHDVEFILMQEDGELLEEAKKIYKVTALNSSRIFKLPFILSSYLKANKPDVLIVAMWPMTVIAPVARLISGQRFKIIASEHNTLSVQYENWGFFHRIIMRMSMMLGYRFNDHLVGVSHGVVKDIAKLSFMKPDKFNIIYNPVTPRKEPSIEELKRIDALWGVPRGSRILTVGSLKLQKNHTLLLKAFADLDIPNARLMIVGEGKERKIISKLARDLGISKKVILAGFYSNPTPFYKTADLFVLTSNYEGFGNVLIESMACGTPVVSTDCPSGPNEITNNGRFGALVPTKDKQALTKAIINTLKSPINPDKLRNRANTFSSQKSGLAYLRLLNTK